MSKDLRQLKSNEIASTRDEILKEQNGKCSLCNNTITETTGVSLDHQHKTLKETIGVDGAGLIRGVLCRSCNVLEGKIWNNTSRYLQSKNVNERIKFLESLISYYQQENYPLVHPSEKEKEKKVSKRNYNKLKKVYTQKAKFPEYPKSGKLTKPLEKLFSVYEISPWN